MKDCIIASAKVLRDYHHVNHIIESADIVLVMGSHDLRVADRGVELIKKGLSDLILFSGGVGRLTDDDPLFVGTTEAELFAQRARDLGIANAKILVENRSSNTGENIRFSYDLLKKKSIESAILVQKPYMERRALATFEKQRPGKHIKFTVTSPQISFEDYPNTEISLEKVINIMVGDLERVIKYPSRGFQTYQHIPNHVMNAYEFLIAEGYTKSLI